MLEDELAKVHRVLEHVPLDEDQVDEWRAKAASLAEMINACEQWDTAWWGRTGAISF